MCCIQASAVHFTFIIYLMMHLLNPCNSRRTITTTIIIIASICIALTRYQALFSVSYMDQLICNICYTSVKYALLCPFYR